MLAPSPRHARATRCLLVSTALALSLGAGSTSARPELRGETARADLHEARPAAARIEPRAGTLRIESAGTIHQRSPREGALELHGAARLVLGSGTRASLAWPGIASAELIGPLELAWTPPANADVAPALELLSLGGRLELEWRRDGTLKLAQGYELDARRCALELLGRPGATLELVHRGGEDLVLRSLVERTPGTWPSRLRSGASAKLAPPERTR